MLFPLHHSLTWKERHISGSIPKNTFTLRPYSGLGKKWFIQEAKGMNKVWVIFQRTSHKLILRFILFHFIKRKKTTTKEQKNKPPHRSGTRNKLKNLQLQRAIFPILTHSSHEASNTLFTPDSDTAWLCNKSQPKTIHIQEGGFYWRLYGSD